MRLFAFTVAALVSAAVLGPPVQAQPAPIRVLSTNGVKSVVEELQSDIERRVGRSLAIQFSTASSLARAIEVGEPFDVAILTPELLDGLIAAGKVTADSVVEIARSGVGVGARPATGSRDVSTAAALKETLLAAQSVAFTAGGQSRVTIDAAFARLGIVEPMRAKTLLLGPGEAPLAVAAGEAELVLTLVSEILPVPGLELVGPFPSQLQRYVSFAAASGRAAADPVAARALLEYLAGADFATALAKHGMEPLHASRAVPAVPALDEERRAVW